MCKATPKEKVIAMYNIHGIQKYIFRTTKVKDAIGASWIIENLLAEVLKEAVEELKENGKRENHSIKAKLDWCNKEEWFSYEEDTQDVQVLYIGGGNAFVAYRDQELCQKVNSLMAYHTLKKTYSLQLAVAVEKKGSQYAEDYRKLCTKMSETKIDMILSKPLGTLPIMEMERKTGYPMISKEGSTETKLKKESGTQKQRTIVEKEEKLFDSYVTKKGIDSMIAVVHIDGNSMGQRIQEYISEIQDYTEAVNTIRKLSFYINDSYKKVFLDMKNTFYEKLKDRKEFKEKENLYFIREILVAGDDVTFVCNGKIALAAVEYFCRKITEFTMNGKTDKENIQKYGFSVCAGIAYIGSHFPFHVGYEVAEACCQSAKDRAKKSENMDGDRVGNFVDFHICKNIQAKNFQLMRNREYQTSSGEQLLIRPYYIRTKAEGNLERLNKENFAFENLKKAISYFQDEKQIPKSFAKELRNTYALGEDAVHLFYSFLESRGWKMPDGEEELYIKNGENIAKWYDALELQDCYMDLDEIIGKEA